MRIPRPPSPAIQSQRFAMGQRAPAPHSMQRTILPVGPPGSRISQQPSTLDQWGRMSGLGNADDRTMVPVPASGGLLGSPLVCAILGFVAVSALSR